MIFDIPKNLPIPNMSSLPSSIPDWNQMHKDLLVSVFDFASGHAHDDGVLLLFLPDDLKLKATLQGYMEAYHFSVYQEWMGVNRLRLTNSRDLTTIVSYILILLNLLHFHLFSFLLLTAFHLLFHRLCVSASRTSSLHLLHSTCARARCCGHRLGEQ
jgi:hypothetical protein